MTLFNFSVDKVDDILSASVQNFDSVAGFSGKELDSWIGPETKAVVAKKINFRLTFILPNSKLSAELTKVFTVNFGSQDLVPDLYGNVVKHRRKMLAVTAP